MLDDIKKTLWVTADKLRANMDAAEYKHLVLGLLFVKYISDSLRLIVKRILSKYKYPPDMSEAAIELVQQQVETLGDAWV